MRTLWQQISAVALLVLSLGNADAQVTLRVAPHSDLKILDPIWTGGYITRNHGYLIYDTLFAVDEQGDAARRLTLCAISPALPNEIPIWATAGWRPSAVAGQHTATWSVGVHQTTVPVTLGDCCRPDSAQPNSIRLQIDGNLP